MARPSAKLIRRCLRALPSLVGAALLFALLSGRLSSLATLHIREGLLLLALAVCIVLLSLRRMRKNLREERLRPLEEAELGALLLVGAFALVQPWGGVLSSLHPLVYLMMAFVVGFLPPRVGIGLTLFAIAVEAGLFVSEGLLPERWTTFFSHAFFVAVFASLNRLVVAAQLLSGRAEGRLAIRAQRTDIEEKARDYRLAVAASDELDTDQWLTAAVREVDEAMGNALEMAEYALRSHTVAVFLLGSDESTLRLRDCRSPVDDVVRTPFDAREGILGAALKRRQPMRLCGDIKGIGWYGGRHPVKSVIVVPLIDRRGVIAGPQEGRLRGLLVADRLEQQPFSEEDERLLSATAREILRAMDAERLMAQVKRGRDEREKVSWAMRELNQASKLAEVLDTIARVASTITPLDLVAITMRREEGDVARHKIARIVGAEAFRKFEDREFVDNGGLVANAAKFGIPLPSRDIRRDERLVVFDAALPVKGLRSLRVVPIRVGDSVTGTIVCGTTRDRAFDAEAIRMLQVIALQAGPALERAQLYKQMEMMATTDGLTGLLNHRTFQTRFDESLQLARRTQKPVALILTDIDHFKSVNDTYGHAAGDAVLRDVAKILQRTARTTDLVARYGGEEFALVLPETDMAGARVIAERIREAVMNHEFQTELGPLRCTLSLGIASFPEVSESKQVLFEKADQCLYHCKRMGRNRSFTAAEMAAEGLLATG